jgi:DNA polymerase V
LWEHTPLTDFWRVGKAYARKLQELGMYTMGDVALKSVSPGGEDLLYKIFGVGAEFLIDHAWGWEPCEMKDIRAYTPKAKSIGSGQVLHIPYTFDKAKLVTREMTELLVLDLVEKKLVTRQVVLTVGYDIENLKTPGFYTGEITTDHYGRKIPKHAHGTANLEKATSSTKLIVEAVMKLYDEIVNPKLLVRRINISVSDVKPEGEEKEIFVQTDLFTDSEKEVQKEKQEKAELGKEKDLQKAIISLKKKYGKNAVLKGMNLEEGATAIDRNKQIGGHKA